MIRMDRYKTGLAVGAFAGLVHLVWAILVAMNLAQAWMDWILGSHFLNNPYQVATFSITTALMLVVMASVVGYIVGFVFATVWNTVRR